MNGYNYSERGSIFEDSSISIIVDEYLDNNFSFIDDSSGDESFYFNCVFIDLFCKYRIEKLEFDQFVFLDNLIQFLLNIWDLKVRDVDSKEDLDILKNFKLNLYQKVIFFQLFFGYKNEENIERNNSFQEVYSDVIKFSTQNYIRIFVIESFSINRIILVSISSLLVFIKVESFINFF